MESSVSFKRNRKETAVKEVHANRLPGLLPTVTPVGCKISGADCESTQWPPTKTPTQTASNNLDASGILRLQNLRLTMSDYGSDKKLREQCTLKLYDRSGVDQNEGHTPTVGHQGACLGFGAEKKRPVFKIYDRSGVDDDGRNIILTPVLKFSRKKPRLQLKKYTPR